MRWLPGHPGASWSNRASAGYALRSLERHRSVRDGIYRTHEVYEAADAEASEALPVSVTAGSAVSWQHIKLFGEYDFSDETFRDSAGIRTAGSLAIGAP